ncbi:MAG: exo-alpha-sialidase [Bacteroidia bacterium]
MKKLFLVALLLLSINILKSQEQNISNGTIFEGEPYIAINPANTQNIVVAWMGYVYNNGSGLTIKVKSSFDGGNNWSSTLFMPHVVSTYKSADPSLAFDNNGNLFLSYIDYRENPDSGGVYLLKSTNGGLSWGNPIKMIDMYADGNKLPIDRPWLVINPSGDKLFLTTKPAPWIAAPNRPYFLSSADSGQTWTPWRYIDTTNFLVGSLITQPMAAPTCSGNLFQTIYPSYLTSQSVYPRYIIASTSDNGLHFTYNTVINILSAANNDSAKLGYRLIHNPANTNHLAFIYPGGTSGDIDIMMTESTNGGANWSTPIRINDDNTNNGKMQDMIWADFDTDGDIIITWRDRRSATGNGYAQASEFYAAYRSHDSTQFSPNFKLSNLVNFNTILLEKGNDFMSTELLNDTLYSVYGTTKDGSLDIWFLKTSAITGISTSIKSLEHKQETIFVSPNPSSGNFLITAPNNIQNITIINVKGETVHTGIYNSNNIAIDLKNKPNGMYNLVIKTNSSTYTRKVLINK